MQEASERRGGCPDPAPEPPASCTRQRRRALYAQMRAAYYSRSESAAVVGISYSTARRWDPQDIHLPEEADRFLDVLGLLEETT